jgi:RimJ/RimL family protein N-acetyltransferase
MLNPDFLGKGFGSKVIKIGVEEFIKDKNPKESLIAEIKKDNIATIKAFQKAGYKENHLTYIFDLNREIQSL